MSRRRIGFALLAVALLLVTLRTVVSGDTAEALGRRAVDVLITGAKLENCGPYGPQERCSALARIKRALGLPPPTLAPGAAGNALSVEAAMESLHLEAVVQRTNDRRPEDSLIVRVDDGQMWLDFSGKNRAGQELTVSVALDSAGGTPFKLVAHAGADTAEIALSGTPLRSNDGQFRYLAPEAGTTNPRFAIWLDLPNDGRPKTYAVLADNISRVDPAFVPRIAKAVFASMAAPILIEERMGLYPALRSIDEHADRLRTANAPLWLPQAQTEAFVKSAYADDPSARASWALALCESATRPPVMDASCWQRLTGRDPAVTSLLRNEVAQQLAAYQALEQTHPLRQRLARLNDALNNPAAGAAGMDQAPASTSPWNEK